MQRESFFGRDTTEFVSYTWPLPDIGKHRVAFGLCDHTGLVMQTDTVTPELMCLYYRATATYVNPADQGRPTAAKARDVDRLIGLTRQVLGALPRSVFQVGSSDGYTLFRFRSAGAEVVFGVDPGAAAVEYAEKTYGVASISSTIEEVEIGEHYALAVLTHVLEHLYDPRVCLARVYDLLEDDGHILVEVPLWERPEMQPFGVLAFEHLNYFCERNLLRLLVQAKFEPLHIQKNYYINHYPVITVVAKKRRQPTGSHIASAYCDNADVLQRFLRREMEFYAEMDRTIMSRLNAESATYVYGGGIHTSQAISGSCLGSVVPVSGIFDSSPAKQGKRLGDWVIQPPEGLTELPAGSNIVVSSAAWQESIKVKIESLRSDLNIITLYQG